MMTKIGCFLNSARQMIGPGQIIFQHDGAPAHNGRGNAAFWDELEDDFIVETQPPQSPDLNKNDLCVFASLQARADILKGAHQSKDALMDAVMTAYNEYDMDCLERVDALLFTIYRLVLDNGGSNQFEIPHTGIRNRQKNGENVTDYSIPEGLVQKARDELARLRAL
jgi:prepilin-type processing-associated H-X9-DG protein